MSSIICSICIRNSTFLAQIIIVLCYTTKSDCNTIFRLTCSTCLNFISCTSCFRSTCFVINNCLNLSCKIRNRECSRSNTILYTFNNQLWIISNCVTNCSRSLRTICGRNVIRITIEYIFLGNTSRSSPSMILCAINLTIIIIRINPEVNSTVIFRNYIYISSLEVNLSNTRISSFRIVFIVVWIISCTNVNTTLHRGKNIHNICSLTLCFRTLTSIQNLENICLNFLI